MARISIYDPKKIEAKWVKEWAEKGIYKTSESGNNNYILGMFPYPSGEGLHVGHARIFTACDVLARFYRMMGDRVLLPIGWDAFGLPAENAAIKAKVNPMDLVPKNEANFKRQMQMCGLSFDWDREFSTTNPEYYKWTQWLFLKLYSLKGKDGKRLVERKEVPINWCPFCKTGLANEEVLTDGTHERCGNKVEQRSMKQWVMRITEYAEELLSDLEGLDWPKGILEMQKNWIGKRVGAKVKFGHLEVFTTRLDTICGVTFIVVAPEVAKTWELSSEARTYVERALNTPELKRQEGTEKTGVKTNKTVKNPITGEEVEVWIGDYVLGSVGTGAVMGVPAHDTRDMEFAKKYKLSVKTVVEAYNSVADGVLVNSGKYTGLTSEKARAEMLDDLENQGFATKMVDYHLRDWIFSRQRYWGEPFPIVYCETCGDENGVVVLNEDQLPVELPYLQSYEPSGTGESPLAKADEWVKVKCPKCGGEARRETDTMPNWAGSCWYFLAFPFWKKLPHPDPLLDKERKKRNLSEVWNEEIRPVIKEWLPVDWYLGGAEHAVLHLLYARFWIKAFRDLNLLDIAEPFTALRIVGMVLAEDGRKMSKSWGNVINPDEMVERFGADTLRLYEMFMGPWDQAIAWETRAMVGCYRFLEKVNNLFQKNKQITNHKSQVDESATHLKVKLNKLVIKVEKDYKALKFNTIVAGMMELVNDWSKSEQGLDKEGLKIFLKVLAPIAPFLAEELWRELGESESIHLSAWPRIAAHAINPEDEVVNFVVQVNGKLRSVLTNVSLEEAKDRELIQERIFADEKMAKWVSKNSSNKVVFVPGKLINFVV